MSHGKFPFTLSDYLRLKASAVVVHGGGFFLFLGVVHAMLIRESVEVLRLYSTE